MEKSSPQKNKTEIADVGKRILENRKKQGMTREQLSERSGLAVQSLVKIETGKNISVIGIISDIQDIEMDWGGQKYTSPHYIMDIAYLVD